MEEGAFAGRRRVGRRPPVTLIGGSGRDLSRPPRSCGFGKNLVWVPIAVTLLTTACARGPKPSAAIPSPTPSERPSPNGSETVNGLHRRVVDYDPPVLLGPNKWLFEVLYLSGFPGAPSAVVRIRCTRSNKVDPPHVSTEQCETQRLPGTSRDLWVNKDGDVFSQPPF